MLANFHEDLLHDLFQFLISFSRPIGQAFRTKGLGVLARVANGVAVFAHVNRNIHLTVAYLAIKELFQIFQNGIGHLDGAKARSRLIDQVLLIC